MLTYLGETSIVVKGTHTGLTYLFGPRGETLTVDRRDAPDLLATKCFVRA